MPKTPDEIKKGLGFCSRATCGEKDIECPYECGNSNCMTHLTCDALALIQQLESKLECSQMTIDGLTATLLKCDTIIQQLEAERDAAVADILYAASVYLGECNTCKNGEVCAACKRQDACDECPNSKCMCSGCGAGRSNWQWRGVQKEAAQ